MGDDDRWLRHGRCVAAPLPKSLGSGFVRRLTLSSHPRSLGARLGKLSAGRLRFWAQLRLQLSIKALRGFPWIPLASADFEHASDLAVRGTCALDFAATAGDLPRDFTGALAVACAGVVDFTVVVDRVLVAASDRWNVADFDAAWFDAGIGVCADTAVDASARTTRPVNARCFIIC